MSHHRIGRLVCLLALIAGLGWSQAAAAATTERDRLEKMLQQAKRKLVIIDQFISELETRMVSVKAEVERSAATFAESGLEEDHLAMLEAMAQYEALVRTLEGARADRVEILSLIRYLKAKLRALGPAPRIGPMPAKGQPAWPTT